MKKELLYKYRTWTDVFHKRILTESELFFASANQFNDPFDAALPYKYRKSDLTPANIYLKLRELGTREWPLLSDSELEQRCYELQMSGDFESDSYWQKMFPSFKKLVNEYFGILSLTTHRDNLLMWSHYADSHKGFCVGLDLEILFRNLIHQKKFFLDTVKYISSDYLPEIPLFADHVAAVRTLITTKSSQWSYENEFRIIKIEGSREVIKMPVEAVAEIIIGCNMPSKEKDEVYRLAKSNFPTAQIFETAISSEKFTLDFRPILK